MMAVVGAAALAWFLVPFFWRSKRAAVRVLGAVVVALAGAGAVVPFVLNFIPEKPPTAREQAIALVIEPQNLLDALNADIERAVPMRERFRVEPVAR